MAMSTQSKYIAALLTATTITSLALAIVYGKRAFGDSNNEEYGHITSGYFPEVETEDYLKLGTQDTDIARMIRDMSPAEILGQINQHAEGLESGPNGVPSEVKKLVKKGVLGSVINVKSADEAEYLQSLVPNGIPLMIGYDIIRGYKTIFPNSLALAGSFDPDMVEAAQYMSAIEGRSDGITWTFSPMIDTARDARWGRMAEGFGEDTLLVGDMGVASIRGYQKGGMMACAKHLLGYGGSHDGRDYSGMDHSWKYIMDEYAEPFIRAIKEAGVMSTMASYTTQGPMASHGYREMHTDLQRGLWGHEGVVISDIYGAKELTEDGHHSLEGLSNGGLEMLSAGVDVDMFSKAYYPTLVDRWDEKVRDGYTVADYARASAARMLIAKKTLGFFDKPKDGEKNGAYPTRQFDWTVGFPEEHKEAAIASIPKSTVLFKNEKNALPIVKPCEQKILVVGDFADEKVSMLGFWHAEGEAMTSFYPTYLQGMKDWLVENCEDVTEETVEDMVHFKNGSGVEHTFWFWPNPSNAEWEAELDTVDYSEYTHVVLFMGEGFRQNGEASARSDMRLPYNQPAVVRKVSTAAKAAGAKVHLVPTIGRPNIITEEFYSTSIDSILIPWTPGSFGGIAVPRMLFGEVSPSGRLPVVWPRSQGQMPATYKNMSTNRPWSFDDDANDEKRADKEADYAQSAERIWTYYQNRWATTSPKSFDTGSVNPLRNFGFGETYNKVTNSLMSMECSITAEGDPDTCRVSGTASRAKTNSTLYKGTATVIQVYAELLSSRDHLAPYYRKLIGYKRVEFADEETKTTFEFDVDVKKGLTQYDSRAHPFIAHGHYRFYVGSDAWEGQKMLLEMEM